MLFSKEFLTKEVENAEKEESLKRFPWQRSVSENDKVPFDVVIGNKLRYFDLKSSQLKDLMFRSRKNISEKCFTKDLNGTFPNEGKIESCVRENEDEFKQLEKLRETHFANIFYLRDKERNNCPSHDVECLRTADKKFVWNASKLPYFFAEKY